MITFENQKLTDIFILLFFTRLLSLFDCKSKPILYYINNHTLILLILTTYIYLQLHLLFRDLNFLL